MFRTGVHAQTASGVVGDTPRFFHFQAKPALHAAARSQSNLVTSVPSWSSLFAYNGLTYPYQMVGTDPSGKAATTTVKTEIIPLKLVFADGSNFDGTSRVASTVNSPLFKKASYTSGYTQYGDAIQRAEWWKYAGHKNYHVWLGAPNVYPTVTLTIPAANGTVAPNRHTGQPEGLIDINWFDPQIQSLITSLGIGPKTFPIFLTDNTFLYQGDPSSCCIIGYHNALPSTDAHGKTTIQTYAWGSYNDAGMFSVPIQDINALSHEIAEWYNDPFVDNITPNWSSPLSPQYGCNNALESGDPLVGITFTVNGYHPQDEAFYSWFARQVPSVGIRGQYTYLATFASPPPTC